MSGERLRYVLPGRSFSSPLGLPGTRLGRCFLPTSATDFQNEHPETVRVLSARREPCRPRDLPTEIRRLPRRRAISAPDRNQEDRGGPTSGGRAIDGAPPTSVVSTTACLEEASRAPRERGCLVTALSAACQAGDRPLTLSVAPRCSGNPEDSRSQRRFRRTLVKRSDFRDAERLPSTSAPWSGFRRSIEGEPATDFAVLPPRLRLPTLFRPLSLSRWRARPEVAPRAIHPWPPRAARRLSISATVTTQEHNCAIVQTPPTTPVVAHVRSFLHSMHRNA